MAQLALENEGLRRQIKEEIAAREAQLRMADVRHSEDNVKLRDVQRTATQALTDLAAAQERASLLEEEAERLRKAALGLVSEDLLLRTKQLADKSALEILSLKEQLLSTVPREKLTAALDEVNELRRFAESTVPAAEAQALRDEIALLRKEAAEAKRLRLLSDQLVPIESLRESEAREQRFAHEAERLAEELRRKVPLEDLEAAQEECRSLKIQLEEALPRSQYESLREDYERVRMELDDVTCALRRAEVASNDAAKRAEEERELARSRLHDLASWAADKSRQDMAVTQAEIDGLKEEARRREEELAQEMVPRG